jgi:hypothetical protein
MARLDGKALQRRMRADLVRQAVRNNDLEIPARQKRRIHARLMAG